VLSGYGDGGGIGSAPAVSSDAPCIACASNDEEDMISIYVVNLITGQWRCTGLRPVQIKVNICMKLKMSYSSPH
jgi:hypothetical protein